MTMIQRARQAMRGDVRDRVTAGLEEARLRLRERGEALLDDAQYQGRKAIRSTRGWVVRHPGAAVGAAFVAGLAAFALIRRNRQD